MDTLALERGLCESCAKYNWHFLLTRSLKDIERDEASVLEESLLSDFYKNIDNRHRAKGHCNTYYPEYAKSSTQIALHTIQGAPYSGSYRMSCTRQDLHLGLPGLGHMFKNQKNCSICGLVVEAMRQQMPSDLEKHLAFEESADFAGWSNSCIIQPDGMPKIDRAVCVFRLFLNRGPNQNPEHIMTASFAMIRSDGNGPSRTLVNPSKIETSTIQNWWKVCQENHGENCKPSPESLPSYIFEPGNPKFKVVDVKTNRVVTQPSFCRYIALSYVWGTKKFYRVTKADFVHPSSNSASDPQLPYVQLELENLPRTIQDAMRVTELLGERYLWIDSLCITQDDPDEMNILLHIMDRIYKAALLTIIAANGDSASAGLTGLDPGSRAIQLLEKLVDGVHLVEAEEGLNNEALARQSIWGSRAWTYQEHIFSSRSLIFYDTRVFYECPAGTWAESRPTESTKISSKSPGIYIEDPQPAFETRPSWKKHRSVTPIRTYCGHVELFTQRQLSYTNDVLNAFTAIIEDLNSSTGDEFCWGVPKKHFMDSLFWKSKDTSRNPNNSNEISGVDFPSWKSKYISPNSTFHRRPTNITTGINFPSWSWAGWVGAVEFPYQWNYDDAVYPIDCAIKWPWDPEYEEIPGSDSNDVFTTGILYLSVKKCTIKPITINEENSSYHHTAQAYGRMIPKKVDTDFIFQDLNGDFQMVLLGDIPKTLQNAPYRYLVMVVRREADGICYRCGVFWIGEALFESCEWSQEAIRLG